MPRPEATRVDTSSVSKRVSRLEEKLGVRLLERTTRRVRLTEAGQTFDDRCAGILRALEDAEAAVTDIAGEPRAAPEPAREDVAVTQVGG